MSKALLKYIRLSPIKARLIAREIQGMNAELALATLEFAPNKAARVIYKVLASAIANGSYDAQSVIVKSCRIDAGPVLRRMSPRARGRANMIRKPTAHILVEVATKSEIEAQKAKDKESKKAITKPKAESSKKISAKKLESKVAESKKADLPKDSSKSAPKAKKDSPKDLKPKAESKVAESKTAKVPKEPKAQKTPTKKPSATKIKATKNKDEDK